jgi:hypothetical protein
LSAQSKQVGLSAYRTQVARWLQSLHHVMKSTVRRANVGKTSGQGAE